MNGEIGYQDKQTIILYSPKESAKRMSEYRQEKEEAIENAKAISPIPEIQESQASLQEETREGNVAENEQETNQPQESEEIKQTEPVAKKRNKSKQLKIDDLQEEDKKETKDTTATEE